MDGMGWDGMGWESWDSLVMWVLYKFLIRSAFGGLLFMYVLVEVVVVVLALALALALVLETDINRKIDGFCLSLGLEYWYVVCTV